MKFDIDIDNYQGEDLILLVGTPGSKWSSVHRYLVSSDDINQTELSKKRKWSRKIDVNDKIMSIGNHRGVYWGPYNEHGQKFDKLNTLSKQEIVSEFMNAFDNWEKIKIIKSHWFAYHLDFLHNIFPKATFVSCYANDDDCYFWWKKVGGWGLPYPSYEWYENDEKMLKSIKEENSRILKFNIDRDAEFKYYAFKDIFEAVDIKKPESFVDENTYIITRQKFSCKISIINREYITNFNYLIVPQALSGER